VTPGTGLVRARLAVVAGASIGLVMAVQGVLPALPALQDEFGFGNEETGLFTLVYVLPGVFLTIPMSVAGSILSPRTVLALSLIVYGVTGAAQAWCGSYEAMLALRLVQGICFAAAMPLTLALIGDVYDGPAGQVRAVAIRQTTITVGEFALPLLGAALAVASWRAPLLVQVVMVPLGLLALWVLEPRSGDRAPELSGARRLWRAVFRRRGPAAVVMLLSFGRFLFKFSYIAYVPILLVEEFGASVFQAGLVVSVASGLTGLTASRMPALLRRAAPSQLAALAAAAIGASLLALAVVHDWRVALATAVLFGLGDGVLIVLQDLYVTRLWEPAVRPGAASFSQTARNLGKLASPLAMTAFIVVASVPAAFALMAAIAAAMVPLFAWLRTIDPQLAPAATARAA
jgi:ACDE family multidrug resistance protein